MGWGPLGDVEEAGFTAADGIREGQWLGSSFMVAKGEMVAFGGS